MHRFTHFGGTTYRFFHRVHTGNTTQFHMNLTGTGTIHDKNCQSGPNEEHPKSKNIAWSETHIFHLLLGQSLYERALLQRQSPKVCM
ncbi:hypothetical protein SDC9_202874 [bioreactor metagenome]|uniref:Uncharacterized protein n=1 Tax=bioreactor metagenome TaxID=1076179 RepID=A0A645IUU5_9ZZZZ